MNWQPVDGARPDQPLTRPSRTESADGLQASNAVASSSTSSNGETRSTLASHKGRKLNRTLPQLRRNAACTTCKRRRVRCDSAKPQCASCVKHFAFLARTQPDPERDSRGVQCIYEDEDDADGEDAPTGPVANASSSVSRSSSDPVAAPRGIIGGQSGFNLGPGEEVVSRGTKRRKDEEGEDGHAETVRTLEARVAALQAQLATGGQHPRPSRASSTPMPPPPPHTGLKAPIPLSSPSTYIANDPSTYAHLQPVPSIDPYLGVDMMGPGDGMPFATTSAESAPRFNANATFLPNTSTLGFTGLDPMADDGAGGFAEMIWPGWPRRLPAPAMLDHLVTTFFSTVPSIPRLLNERHLTARLALPPQHVDFPHASLLHMICAVAGRFTAAVSVDSTIECMRKHNAEYNRMPQAWDPPAEQEIEAITDFSEQQARWGLRAMRKEGLLRGRAWLEIVQAQLIYLYYCKLVAKWVDGYIFTGLVARSCAPLGLYHEAEILPSIFSSRQQRSGVLPSPVDEWDRQERRAAMYACVSGDAMLGCIAEYPVSVDVEEITAPMPGTRIGPEWLCAHEDQTCHSPNLYTFHPAEDSTVLFLKSTFLMGRIGRLTRRIQIRRSMGQAPKMSTSEFQRLARDVSDFRKSFPKSLSDPLMPMRGTTNRIDADLVVVHMLKSVMVILLHAPFVDLSDHNNIANTRFIEATRECDPIVSAMVNSGADMAIMLPPDFPLIIFVPCRALMVLFEDALQNANHSLAMLYLQELQVYKRALVQLGGRLALAVQYIEITRHIIESISTKYGVVLTGSADPDPSIITMPFKPKTTVGTPVANSSPALSNDRAGSAVPLGGPASVLEATTSRSSSVPFRAQAPHATTMIPPESFAPADIPAAFPHPSLGTHPGHVPVTNPDVNAGLGTYSTTAAAHLPQVYVPSSLDIPTHYPGGGVGLPPNGVRVDNDDSCEFAAWSTADGIQEYRQFSDLNMNNLAMRPS